MRLRKKPWARPELENCGFFVINPKENKGQWLDCFEKRQPVYLELGCGKGTFMAVHGACNPNINYIAIDIKDVVLGLAKRNIVKAYEENNRDLDNIKLMAQEIGLISNVFDEDDIVDRIYINFCNPWPREKHKKRRLTHIRQLNQYRIFLKDKGEIHFKTDNDELFEESLEYFKESKFNIKYITYDLHNSDYEGNVETEHEKMFTEQGIKTKFLIAVKEN